MSQDFLNEAGSSFPPVMPVTGDQREAPRLTLLIRAAKLIADGREFLCVIRDASSKGIKIRLFHAIPEHRKLEVELANGDRHPIEMVWNADEHAGFRFPQDVDIERLVDESQGAFPRRQVRLRITLEATIKTAGETVRVEVQDISQQGACIESDKWLLKNELIRVDTGILPPIYAKVRWRRHPRYGLVFEQTFRLDELARLAAPHQFTQAIEEAVASPPNPAERRA